MYLEQHLKLQAILASAQEKLYEANRLRQWWYFDLTAAACLIIFGSVIQEVIVIYSSWGFLLSWNISLRRHRNLVTTAETEINYVKQAYKEHRNGPIN